MLNQQTDKYPPRLVQSFITGFDRVANHIELALFPIGLDLLLWLGPHFRTQQWLQQLRDQVNALTDISALANNEAVLTSQEFWQMVIERFNLLTLLRSYPVGIPSLMAGRNPVESPLGTPLFLEIPSLPLIIGLWLLLNLVGLVSGSLFYLLVTQAVLTKEIRWRQALKDWPWASGQVIGLTIGLFILFFALSFPASCVLSVATLAGVGQCLIAFGSVLFLWLLFPLFLSAHGIFVNHDPLVTSIRKSVRLSRVAAFPVSMMFMLIILLTQGLDLLWNVTNENSWLSLFGILGHAFVTTGLLAGTFHFYQEANQWIQNMMAQKTA